MIASCFVRQGQERLEPNSLKKGSKGWPKMVPSTGRSEAIPRGAHLAEPGSSSPVRNGKAGSFCGLEKEAITAQKALRPRWGLDLFSH